MINAADLPAVRERAENQSEPIESNQIGDVAANAPAAYPSKTLVLENGRYVTVTPTK